MPKPSPAAIKRDILDSITTVAKHGSVEELMAMLTAYDLRPVMAENAAFWETLSDLEGLNDEWHQALTYSAYSIGDAIIIARNADAAAAHWHRIDPLSSPIPDDVRRVDLSTSCKDGPTLYEAMMSSLQAGQSTPFVIATLRP